MNIVPASSPALGSASWHSAVENPFAAVKAATTIEELCRYYGVELNRAHMGLCPLHSEKTPSFRVSPEKGLWYCFGCDEGGDVISLVSKIEKISPLDAARRISEIFHLHIFQDGPKPRKKRWRDQRPQKQKNRRLKEAADRGEEALRRKIQREVRQELQSYEEREFERLCAERREKFLHGEDCAYEDELIDALQENPLLYRATAK